MGIKMNSSADHELYTASVDAGIWPKEKLVPLPQSFINDAGIIQNLILHPITSVAIITSKADTIRANHYHKTDWHYVYIISGKIVYFERKVGETKTEIPHVFLAGQMFFTPPMIEHVMYFPVETTFITMANNIRSHESHEADLVRVNFITKDMIPDRHGY
jgi:dTDP-4-dehydrorhamnose 3,5-epimerase-like enzyme